MRKVQSARRFGDEEVELDNNEFEIEYIKKYTSMYYVEKV
jgi:hypothetical protein